MQTVCSKDFNDKFEIIPKGTPNGGITFHDHSPLSRSGHLGHALVEYEPSKIIAFYPDCSDVNPVLPDFNGHSGNGYMRYKRSLDGGLTWSEPYDEPNSKMMYDADCGSTLMCEKAVVTDSGRIVLFYVKCCMTVKGDLWEPYLEPQYAVSDDKGETFSQIKCFDERVGRIFDAKYKDGVIYVLYQLGEYSQCCNGKYLLYVSEDDGESFTPRSEIPFDGNNYVTFYGTMDFDRDGRLRVYAYDEQDEYNLRYIVSDDLGKTWGANRRAFFEKRMRNPQIARFADTYFMHGRSGCHGINGDWGDDSGNLVLYTSSDGYNWDEGRYLQMRKEKSGAYSNNVVVHSEDGEEIRLLIQTSHAYDRFRTNVYHFRIEKK